jgi:hypothetical protein
MSLQDWQRAGWLVEHRTSSREVADLLGVADRDLKDCKISSLSADWRLNIAYNAALQVATIALAAAGFRAARDAHHYRVIQSLSYTIGTGTDRIAQFELFRKKRNIGGYERAGSISEREASEMASLAGELRQRVQEWLEANHPELLKDMKS